MYELHEIPHGWAVYEITWNEQGPFGVRERVIFISHRKDVAEQELKRLKGEPHVTINN